MANENENKKQILKKSAYEIAIQKVNSSPLAKFLKKEEILAVENRDKILKVG